VTPESSESPSHELNETPVGQNWQNWDNESTVESTERAARKDPRKAGDPRDIFGLRTDPRKKLATTNLRDLDFLS